MRRMALEQPTWGQERIAKERLRKLGLRVSPRTVRKYRPSHGVGTPGQRRQTQRWSHFIRNHAKGILAGDFCVAITATFHILYVFVGHCQVVGDDSVTRQQKVLSGRDYHRPAL
jgi:hypothetical protein